ncbi:uncharacterized protein LOC100878162 [Megachile rotundata]|uniref:uncharacterized protein LOC100878162 n=1 Tax=Megachile rotundata TaxID=143995 RepID=UPI003FD519DC
MSSTRFSTTLTTLVLWACIGFGTGWPLSENTTATPMPMKFLQSSMVTPDSIAKKSNDRKNEIVRSGADDKESSSPFGVNAHRLPPSPANLLKPDRFQFYTYNEKGDMITKQMTMQEIQALIAGGGPDHSNAEVQEPQKVEDILTGGKKVMDVVEKVQSVLKSAMDKPVAALTGSFPTVPEKANVEWSNILPAILAGDKYGDKPDESHYVDESTRKPKPKPKPKPNPTWTPITTLTSTVATVHDLNSLSESDESNTPRIETVPSESSIEFTVRNETTIGQTGKEPTPTIFSTIASQTATASSTEKLMIPVAVITAEQHAQMGQRITQSPVFQKITEIAVVPLENMLDENYDYKENDRHAAATMTRENTTMSTSITITTTDASPSSLDSASKDGTDNVVDLATSLSMDSKNVSWNDPLTIVSKIKPLADIATTTTTTTRTKVRPTLDDDLKTNLPLIPLPESTKVETVVTDKPLTTLLSYPLASITTTINRLVTPLPTESLTSIRDLPPPSTNPTGYLDSTQPPKPLSMELANSLSSMINQVSETLSPVLPISSGFDSAVNSQYDDDDDGTNENEKNPTNITKVFTHTAPTNDSGKFSTMQTTIRSSEEQTFSTTPSASLSSNTVNLTKETNHLDTLTESNDTRFELDSTTKATTIGVDEIVNSSINYFMGSTVTSDRNYPSNVTVEENIEETVTTSSLDSSKTSLDYWSMIKFEDSNANINRSKPTAIIDDILATLSTEVNTPVTETITLPNILPKNSSINTLASGLIAGFESHDSNTITLTTNSPLNLNVYSIMPSAETSSDAAAETTEKYATTIEYAEKETELPVDSSANTRINAAIIEITTKSVGTDENEVSAAINRRQEYPPLITSSGETDTLLTNSISLNTVNVVTAIDSFDSSTSSLQNILKTDQIETTASTIIVGGETTFLEPLKTSSKPTDEIVETNSNESSLSFDTKERPLHVEPTTERQVDSISQSSLKSNAISTDLLSKETLDRLKNETTIVGENSNVIDAMTVVTNSTKSIHDVVRKPTTTIGSSNAAKHEDDYSSHSADTIIEQSDHNELSIIAAINASDSMKSNCTKGETKESNESMEIVSKDSVGTQSLNDTEKSQETNDKIHSDNWLSSNSNKSTGIDSEHMWQLISLHQTTPISSSFASSSHSSSPLPLPSTSSSTKDRSATTKKPETESSKYKVSGTTASTVALNASKIAGGLDGSTKNASADIVNFSRLCNELAFKFWTAANEGLSTGRSLVVSPFGMISLLAMIFLGARGSTSDQMNEVLGLDNVATFNPHLIFQNVTDTVSLARNQGIANAAFVRELFADKAKVRKLLPFYKEQAQQFYEGLVAEVNFATISDLARRRTNLLIRKQTGGRIKDFVKNNAIPLRSPLAAISANVFQTDCNSSLVSATGRDGELYFAVSSSSSPSSIHRLRKLIPVPATVWRSNVLAGYEPNLDATAIAIGGIGQIVSTIFLLPGQQGHVAPGDTLDRLEERLTKGAFRDGTWKKLLKVLIPRTGLELQIPKFTHRSVVNATAALKRMALDQLFSSHADFKGINGIGNRLFLSDVLQMNLFGTCGDENIANGRHHVEIYPASPSLRNVEDERSSNEQQPTVPAEWETVRRQQQVSWRNDRTVSSGSTSTINGENSKDKPRLKLDQPFLYFVRHNPTGLILHMGRFNPRLL